MILFGQEGETTSLVVTIICIVAIIAGLVLFTIVAKFFRLWIQSITTGAGISIWDLIGMYFRKVNAAVITRSKIMAVQAGLSESESGITSKAHLMR